MRVVLGRNIPLAMLAALAMAFAMALAVFASPANAQGGPNEDCPAGTTLLVKFEGFGTADVGDTFGPTNGVTLTVTEVNEDDEPVAFSFVSDTPISAVVVKAAQEAEIIEYDPPVTAGSFETPAENQQGNPQGISNVQFCVGDTTTTTTGTDTTTTGTGTTGTGTTTTGTDTTGTVTTGKTTGVTTSVTTTGDDFDKKYFDKDYYDKYYYDKEYDRYFYYKDYAAPSVQYEDEKSQAAVQYQYSAPEEVKSKTELPETGGSSLLAVGAMVLLLGGGLTALLAVRRGSAG